MNHADWARASRVLCVRLDQLGDVLMTTPALRALRESRPGRRLTLLTASAGAALAPLLPDVDEVIAYDAPWMKAAAPRADRQVDHAMTRRLRQGAFDAAVIFTVYSQSPLPAALLCHLADIPLRLAHCRENPYQLLTDWVKELEPEKMVRHEVRRQLDLVAAVGCQTANERLGLRIPAAARRRVADLLVHYGLDDRRPWVVIHPGASAPSRRYPPENFAWAARELVQAHGWQVVFTGGSDEAVLVEQIRAALAAPACSLAGRLDLGELAALLEQAPLLIANNTGPVHIAAALGTPVVDLYALTNPQHTPWLTPSRILFHDVPCRNCYQSVCPEGHHDCLRRVRPGEVVRAARELMSVRMPPARVGATV
jgi:lipopolysaccharide heptosyltransferase II